MTGDWLVIYTHAGKELLAYENLLNQSIPAYYPQSKVERPNGKYSRWRERPLFPRYLFAQSETYRSIYSTRGVHSIVSLDDKPLTVSGEELAVIQSREIKGFHWPKGIEIDRDYDLAVNAVVKVILRHSCWQGELGRYKGSKQGRLLVEMDKKLFGKTVVQDFGLSEIILAQG
jgi:transcription antitermination factor NusG